MHVVIGGFGRVGRYLAHKLESKGHTVAVIDRSASAFEEFSDIKGRKLTGMVFDRETLIKAGIERADAFAAVTSGDNSNIVAARVAREKFGIANVVARIYDPRRAAMYKALGIPTCSTVSWAGSQLLSMMVEPDLRTDAVYGNGEVITVEADAPVMLTGKRLGDVTYPGKFDITAVVRDGEALLPSPRLELAKGDHLYVTVTRDALDELKQLLEIR